MRQPGQYAVPEHDDLYPLSVQLKGDQWHVFDAAHGGFGDVGYDTYKEAEVAARRIKAAHQEAAAARVAELASKHAVSAALAGGFWPDF